MEADAMTAQHTNPGSPTTGRAGTLSWDWKGQPDLAALGQLLHDLAGLHVREVDNGMEDVTIVISTVPVDSDTATAVWEAADVAPVDLATLPTGR